MEKKGRDLPPYVHPKNGAYYYVRRNKWEFLSRDKETALRLYRSKVAAPETRGMPRLIDEVLTMHPAKAQNTRAQYQQVAKTLKEAFAEFEPHEVRPRDIKVLMRSMKDTPNMANRALSVLRVVFKYAVDVLEILETNPAKQVDRYKEASRKRLLSPDEYWKIHAHANPRLQIIMEICYLTGQRIGDVLSIRRNQIRDGAIEFVQQKTGKAILVSAPGLADAIERAKAIHGQVAALTLFRSRETGNPPTYNAIHKQWTAARIAAGVKDANLHDIRAMSLTAADAEGLNATALAGHTTQAMTARYLRSKGAKAAQGPKMVEKASK